MTSKLAFALIVFAAAVIAAVALLAPSQRSDAPLALGPVLPGLSDQLNDLDEMSLSDLESTLTLQRSDGDWMMPALPGMPIDQGKVREFLLDLAAAKLVEAKTDDPQFHDAIGLGKSATRVTLSGDNGLYIGKATTSGGGYFVRRAGEDQTYIAKPISVPQVQVKAWVDLSVPVAKKDLVTRVEVRDGIANYEVRLDDEELVLLGLQPGEELSYDGVLETVTGGAVFIEFEDIRLASDFDWTGAGQSVFHGATDADSVTYTLLEAEDALWLRAQPSGAFLPEGEIDWARWAFQISDYRKNTLLKPRAELIKVPEDTP